jgi:2-polyprenyl-3-methyl-5-hydroxy-6-metoxy-1,4-benzoquinol methylase
LIKVEQEHYRMSAEFDTYLTNYYEHTASPRALKWNATSARYHHGSHFPVDRSAAILEIGPGFGNLMSLLQKQAGYQNVRGVDVSPEVVNYCNHSHPGSTDLAADTTKYLHDHVEAFDLVLMLHVLEHVPKDTTLAFLQAIRSALRPGGKLIVEVPNAAHPIVGARTLYSDFTHTVGYSEQSFSYVLRSTGFSQVEVYGCKIVPKTLLRLIQRAGQEGVELLLRILSLPYGPTQSNISASLLGACATR